MCRQYDAPPFPLCCPSARASAAASGSASVHLFCHCRCRCHCRCHCFCLCFHCSVWLSYQRPWASPVQTNRRSVLWVAHKAIKQGQREGWEGGGGGRASVCLRLGGMPQTPVQKIFTWLEWRRCLLQLGMGTRSKGATKGARDWARDWEGGKCQWANRKYKSRALKATPKIRAKPRKPRTENWRYQRTKRR